jgi:hypothetical protein
MLRNILLDCLLDTFFAILLTERRFAHWLLYCLRLSSCGVVCQKEHDDRSPETIRYARHHLVSLCRLVRISAAANENRI